MKVTRGKMHECLGVTFDYATKGAVKTNMKECRLKSMKDFPEALDEKHNAPAQDWLFNVRENDCDIPLEEKRLKSFTLLWPCCHFCVKEQGLTHKQQWHF